MKKLLLFVSVLFTVIGVFMLSGCDRSIVVPNNQSKLVGKWTMQNAILNETINGVSNTQTTTFTASDYYDFKADGTVTIVESGATYSGSWKITNDRVYFTGTNYMDNTTGWATPILTANSLQFFNTETNSFSTTQFTVNLSK